MVCYEDDLTGHGCLACCSQKYRFVRKGNLSIYHMIKNKKTVDNIYLITRSEQQVLSFLMHGSRAIEIHSDRYEVDSSDTVVLGNIYIGRIQNIVKNINAAFVELAPGKVCYLPLEDIKHPIYTKKGASAKPQAGDELLVQVLREGIKTKAPALTTNLTLHGKYLLLTTGNLQLSASNKLQTEEKQRLKALVSEQEKYLSPEIKRSDANATGNSDTSSRHFGWLIRTNAGGKDAELILKDQQILYRQYTDILNHVQYRTCGSCLLRRPQGYLARLSDLYETDASRIMTDDAGLYQELADYLKVWQPEDLARLSFYEDRLLPMEKLYALDRRLSEALQERVWLPCGGYLVIQPTEALTVIDVNTGKFEGGKKKEAAVLKVNKEAAGEIAHQIRLRNLSGIILVDFINMEAAASNEELLTLLNAKLREDPIPTTLIDMTKLQLVEITRMKKEKPLSEIPGIYHFAEPR